MPDRHDVLAVADQLWRGELSTTELHPLLPSTGLAEVADGVSFVPSFANVSAMTPTTACSWWIPAAPSWRPRSTAPSAPGRRADSTPRSTPTGTSIMSSGCRCGRRNPSDAGWPEPVVVAHEALPARFDRYILTAGYNGIINRRQFGIDSLEWPTDYRYPDRTYRDRLDLDIGGHQGRAPSRQRARPTTTPGRGSPKSGSCAAATCSSGRRPMPATPRRSSAIRPSGRTPSAGCCALYDSPGGGPEVLLPGHGYPVVGADRVRQALTDTAELLESLVDQTLALMNGGARLDEVIHTVMPPAGADGAALPQAGLRRARIHRADRLAPLRRLVGRQSGLPQAGSRAGTGRRTGRTGRRAPRCSPTGPWPSLRTSATGPEGIGPGRARRRRPAAGRAPRRAGLAGRARRPGGRSRVRRTVFTRRADAASSTMAHGVFSWAARESGDRQPRPCRPRPSDPPREHLSELGLCAATNKPAAQLLILAPVPTSVIAVNAFTTGSPALARCGTRAQHRRRAGCRSAVPVAPAPARGRRWRRRGALLAVGAPLVLAGCNAYPSYGASRGATKQGQETFKLYSGMMTTGIIVGGAVGLLILWTIIRYRKRSDEMPRQFHENVPIEILYTVIPVIIVGLPLRSSPSSPRTTSTPSSRSTPPSPRPESRWSTSRVTAFQWGWRFDYPDLDVGVAGETTNGPGQPRPADGRPGGPDRAGHPGVRRRDPRLLRAGLQLQPLRTARGDQPVRPRRAPRRHLQRPVHPDLRPLPLGDAVHACGRSARRRSPAWAKPRRPAGHTLPALRLLGPEQSRRSTPTHQRSGYNTPSQAKGDQ